MNFKNDELYPLYVAYLERMNMNKGALTLAKISKQFFDDFRKKYDESPGFRDQQDSLYRNISRDRKIDGLISDDDLDRFLEEI
jgi:hypothetical protein